MNCYLGLDVGSVSVKLALIDEENNILHTEYRRHKGKPSETALLMLDGLGEHFDPRSLENVAMTGLSATMSGKTPGINVENEVLCQVRAAAHFYPDTRSIIEIGGQDSKLILTQLDRETGQMIIQDFAMNTICAAGTGSFLDQQASRLNVSIDNEFGELATMSKKPPRIAGRCSVFAKTDMIHLQQEATPVHDIVAGLCFAVARNFVSSIARGKKIESPVAFHGGVASNAGMVRAFNEILGIKDDELRIHKHHQVMGALGAALIAREKTLGGESPSRLKSVRAFFNRSRGEIKNLSQLHLKLSRTSTSPERGFLPRGDEPLEGYLGIDVGSISTNLVVIDASGRVLSKRYLMTAGRPIEAVRQGLNEVGKEMSGRVEIKGVCTTGSGRYLTGDFFGADVVKNEITAQATGALVIDPRVDTIFEIGGQDSKYISIDNGAIVDFEMNKVCAAGTGSFLEEQAEKLGVKIKKDFGQRAIRAKSPCAMGERCTVFIETDLVSNQQKGACTDDLVGGLCYSIAYNYLNKVVGDRRIGSHIFFQGGTAYNDGVVAAFEAILGKKITVPDHHEVTGAVGCAHIARRWHLDTGGRTRFKGFDRGNTLYGQDSFECNSCSNRCEINRVKVEGEKPLFYGGRCEKYEVRRQDGPSDIPDLFAEREEFLLREYDAQAGKDLPNGTVGIPRILNNFELLPYWVGFFNELGYRVVLSDPTNKAIINHGLERVLAEACFPVKVAHGHMNNLLQKEIDFLFLPSIINMTQIYEGFPEAAPCPYAQAIPYILNGAFDLDRQDKVKVLIPTIPFGWGPREVAGAFRKYAEQLKVRFKDIRKAVDVGEEAQNEFYRACSVRGRQILDGLTEEDRAVVIISRPYNGCDQGINLNLPKKLQDLNSLPIPMDFLPLEEVPIDKEWPFMTWKYGQKFLASADLIREDPRLNGLFITNFGCGPDSFLLKFFRKRMGGKVYLQVEIDEHSADVGAITRCEAFLDSIDNIRTKETRKYTLAINTINGNKERRTLYIPHMCDGAYALKAAFIASGVPAEVLPEPDMETLYWGRKYTTGKECFPCIITMGDMVKFIHTRDFNPDKTAFFMPTAGGGCRFGYYNILQRIILEELGYPHVPIYSPHQTESFIRDMGIIGNHFFRQAWNGVVAVDLLDKALRETRPYELKKGQTYDVYREYLQKTCNAIMKKKDILPVQREAREAFEQISVDREQVRPVIGVVGEIFVRTNRFSNSDIVRVLEEMGAEAWVSPFSEWVLYLNLTRKEDYAREKNILDYARLYLEDQVIKKDEHRQVKVWDGFLRSGHEPSSEEVVKLGADYVDPSFRGETILSFGKAVDFYKSGLSGVINLMPFTCMPGTVVNSLLKRLKQNCQEMPVLNVAYDGLDTTNNMLRLEAFVHQCRQYMQKHVLTKLGV
jgi:predicted CoA-substrate-specific enzyme activase